VTSALESLSTSQRPAVRAGSRAVAFARERIWTLVVWTAMLGWSLVLFVTVRTDYRDFRLGRFDLGNMVQTVWNTAHGRPLEMTGVTGEQLSRLAYHVDPILALLAPLWLVTPHPLTLAAVQIAACALGALPVFWLGRRYLLSERAGALVALGYLVFPWMSWTALDAFHPVTLAISLLLFAVWFLDSERLVLFGVCAVLAALTGELVALGIAGLGVWFALARGHRRAGIGIAVAGLAWSVLAVAVVVPAARGDASPFYDRFESVGGSPAGVVRTAFTDPGAILAALTTSSDFSYLAWLTLALLGLFVLSPALAAVGLPQLFVNLLSDSPPTTDPRSHYIAAVVPFLIAATVLGLSRIPSEVRARAAFPAVATFVMLALFLGPWVPIVKTRSVGFHDAYPAEHVRALQDAIALVPRDAPVTATNRAASQLSARRYVYNVPDLDRARWLVLDTLEPRVARTESTILYWDPRAFEAFTARIEASPEWVKVFDRDGVLVLRNAGAG
jgi:uncharacterized membrane protein